MIIILLFYLVVIVSHYKEIKTVVTKHTLNHIRDLAKRPHNKIDNVKVGN